MAVPVVWIIFVWLKQSEFLFLHSVSRVLKLVFGYFSSSAVIHHCKILFFSAKSWYDISPDVSLHSRVSPDVHEWRSVQLQEALPVPAWLHRAPLPVSTPASSGGARQQAAGLSHVSEARQPESWGAIRRGGSPDDANTLIFHTTPDTSRAPLL